MAVSKWERKALIPHGAGAAVAREVGCSRAYVSLVVATGGGKSKVARAVRAGLARKVGVPTRILFPESEVTKQPRGGAPEPHISQYAA